MKSIALISVGNELLNGQTLNTNINFLGNFLNDNGYNLNFNLTLEDDIDFIAQNITNSLQYCDVLITCGGLGPTDDDLTRKAVAKALNLSLIHDVEIEQYLRKLFQQNPKDEEYYKYQAESIQDAIALTNSTGVAPVLKLFYKDKLIILLPGPPREFQACIKEHLLPSLEENKVYSFKQLKTFYTYGIKEYDLYNSLLDITAKYPSCHVAYCAKFRYVRITLRANKDDENFAKLKDELQERLTNVLSHSTLEEDVSFLLKENNFKFSSAESCTAGLLAYSLGKLAGASQFYQGSYLTYSNESKIQNLGVSSQLINKHGAVSSQVALDMLINLQQKMKSNICVSITGIAGPLSDDSNKDIGLVYIGIYFQQNFIYKFNFKGSRCDIQQQVVNTALHLILCHILQQESFYKAELI